MLIGITGQIGAGKSTAARVLSRMGAVIIDADQIGREAVEHNPKLKKQLAKAFGPEVLTKWGNLNRKRTAEIAFSSKAHKRKLDRLVHPFLLHELRQQIKKLSSQYDIIVIDAALLLDWGLHKLVNRVLVIHSGEKKRFKRLQKRGISIADARARQRMQPSLAVFFKNADKIISNDSSKAELEAKVKNWANQFFAITND